MDRNELIKELHCHFPESFAAGFEFSDIEIPNESLLIICLFCPTTKGKKYSFAFKLAPIIDTQNMANKAWITINSDCVKGISYHSRYKEFEYKGEKFHPYSVALSGYIGNAENIKKICTNIYQGNIIHND